MCGHIYQTGYTYLYRSLASNPGSGRPIRRPRPASAYDRPASPQRPSIDPGGGSRHAKPSLTYCTEMGDWTDCSSRR